MRAMIKQLLPHLYLIDDAGDSTCYLLLGSKKALVIDSLNGCEDLHAILRTLTQLPFMVINTHGHVDHVCGNAYFDQAYVHPDDLALCHEHMGYAAERYAQQGVNPPPMKIIQVGDVIDLGGIEVEILSLRGHTPGSIGLLDKQDRILFTGDGCNAHLWMQLDHSLPISVLQNTLLSLKRDHYHRFDCILAGHGKDFEPKTRIDQNLVGCQELLQGKTEQDAPYHYFGGECLQHPTSPIPGECIVYTTAHLK